MVYPESAETTTRPIMDAKDKTNETQLSLYPNPATDIVHVSMSGEELTGDYTLSVFNYLGQMLLSQVFTLSDQDDYNTKLDIADYPSGGYFVHITGNISDVLVEKFVVSRPK